MPYPCAAMPFVAERLPNGDLKTTVPLALMLLLDIAEQSFGSRLKDWTILGSQIGDGPNPKIVYYPTVHNKYIMIELSKGATNTIQAVIELSQEIVHLLTPTQGVAANNLEEGLATGFAVSSLASEFGITWHPGVGTKYGIAMCSAQRLVTLHPNGIKAMRADEPVISRISYAVIKKHCPNVTDADAKFLASPF